MLTNKWWLTGMGVASTLMGYLATVDWNTLVPSKGGMILMGLTFAKTVMSTFLPPPAVVQQAADRATVNASMNAR